MRYSYEIKQIIRRNIMRKVTLFAAALAACVFTAFAQEPVELPKPGPEHKRMAFFIGTWHSEGEMKSGPFGPPGKLSFKDKIEWGPGGFFIVMNSTGKGPAGDMQAHAVMGYDAEKKMYTYTAFNNVGLTETAMGSLTGDTWTWTSESMVAGKLIKSRYIIKETGPASQVYSWEFARDDGTWEVTMEGKATRTP